MNIDKLKAVIKMSRHRLRMKYAAEIRLVKRSGLFDEQFYVSTYDDVSANPFWSKNPILHYLHLGSDELRKCSEEFDTQWYLENNPDVAESSIKPLIHYILHGRQEGRRINGNRYTSATRDRRETLRHTVVNHLWGGYANQALKDLAAIYEAEDEPKDVRFFAAWHAARWYYYEDDFSKTLQLAELIVKLDEMYRLEKTTAMMFAYSYLALGRVKDAEVVAKEFLQRVPQDTDMILTLANTVADEAEKLNVINQIFDSREMAVITKRDEALPLSFANLTAKTNAIHDEEKVSVIMPTFNAEDKIEAALKSLLEQSWQNLEIIVVDDKSTDSTFEVASRMAEREPRLKVFRQERNGGAYLARNRGLKEATGNYITTHDSDDWSHPEKIATQVDLLQRKEDVMGICTHWTRALDSFQFTHNWNLNARLVHWNHSSFLFRKKVIDDIGPWDSVIVGGDTEFIWRVKAYYGNGAVVKYKPNVPYSFALDDEGSLTRTKATHVRTIHNGLRHIYRSAAAWWHATAEDVSVSTTRKFPAPKGMLKRGASTLECDEVYIADFSISNKNSRIISAIKEAIESGKNIGVMHWPKYKSEREELNGEFFKLLLKESCEVVVYGMTVSCKEVIFESADILEPMLEQRPVFVASQVRFLELNDALPVDEASLLSILASQ